jgi:hypothetical protein
MEATNLMSRDSHWVQREMRQMSDVDRDLYIKRSRVMYDETMQFRQIYAKYKPQIEAIEKQRDEELEALEQDFAKVRKVLGL